jgi:signal transduction histidine kinase
MILVYLTWVGDPSLHQIVLNLVSNAVKFIKITVSVFNWWRFRKITIEFAVTDTGIGILKKS